MATRLPDFGELSRAARQVRIGATLLAVVLLAGAAPADARAEPVEMAPPVEYPHAGIALAIPRELTPQALRDPFEVARAARAGGGRTVLALSVSAFPVDSKVQAGAFADAMLAELKRRPGVRKLKVRGRGPLKIAGSDAAARRISYIVGDRDRVVALWAVFVRQVEPPGVRICYFLSVEAAGEHQARIQPVFAEAAKRVRLIDLERPSAKTMGGPGLKLKDTRHGFSIRLPPAWYVLRAAGRHPAFTVWEGKVLVTETPLEMGQTDYLAGGRGGVKASVVVGNIPPGMTAAAFGDQAWRHAVQASARAARVSAGPVRVAGLQGHQGVMKLARRPAGLADPRRKQPRATFVIVRALRVPPEKKGRRGRGYALLVRCRADDAEAAGAMMDRLAAGFELPGVTTKPTTLPAGRPATAPSTVPTGSAADREGPGKTLLRHGEE